MISDSDINDTELFQRIQQQFDYIPYPVVEVENLPTDRAALYYHSLATVFYRRNRRIIEPEGRTILDVGCGSGYKTLLLALANPGAKVVGIDLSDRSLDIARKRFAHHKLEAEFRQQSLFDISDEQFDYINCDEMLYLMPDPAEALMALKKRLKRDGIIRANLHSLFQRFHYYRAQEIFGMMGLMNQNPEEEEIQTVVGVMRSLKPNVDLKKTWNSSYEGQHSKHAVLMNYLFQGDRGFTITDLFALLKESGLEFIDMVNWNQWHLPDLFESGARNVLAWALDLPKEQQLHLFELFHPIHRLLDFWCGIGEQIRRIDNDPIAKLHPLLRCDAVKQSLISAIADFSPFDINAYLPINPQPLILDSSVAVALIPLFEGDLRISELAEYWKSLHPCHPVNGQRIHKANAIAVVGGMLSCLERGGYIFLG